MKASLMLGVNNETKREDNDFYATDPNGLRIVLPILEKIGLNKNIWECSCGNGNLSKVLEENNYKVYSTDLTEWERRSKCDEIDFSEDKRVSIVDREIQNWGISLDDVVKEIVEIGGLDE